MPLALSVLSAASARRRASSRSRTLDPIAGPQLALLHCAGAAQTPGCADVACACDACPRSAEGPRRCCKSSSVSLLSRRPGRLHGAGRFQGRNLRRHDVAHVGDLFVLLVSSGCCGSAGAFCASFASTMRGGGAATRIGTRSRLLTCTSITCGPDEIQGVDQHQQQTERAHAVVIFERLAPLLTLLAALAPVRGDVRHLGRRQLQRLLDA